jgi:hypothetical protein
MIVPHIAGPRLDIASGDDGLRIDTIRAIFTYSIAAVVVIGGGIMLFVSRTDSGIDDLRVVMAGFIGSALTFVFGQEVQTRTARQAAASTAASTAAQTATIAAANSGVGPSATPPPP